LYPATDNYRPTIETPRLPVEDALWRAAGMGGAYVFSVCRRDFFRWLETGSLVHL
jgi:hypothetical protein